MAVMLSTDYYDILNITRSATLLHIREAYRQKALRYHPEKSHDTEAQIIFNDAAEAYQVLSNDRYRALYNQYGRRGLGVAQWIDKRHCGEPPYDEDPKFEKVQLEDSRTIFEQFFATTNPYEAELIGEKKVDFAEEKLPQPPTKETFFCTLEELYTGCEKTITKIIKTESGIEEPKDFHIVIPLGFRPGTQLKFNGAGNVSNYLLPADVIFTMEETSHARFTREGDNLVYKHNILLKKALCGTIVQVLTLDERLLSIPINYVVKPGTRHVVKNEGLPTLNDGEFGDLIIELNIIFPKVVPEKLKKEILKLKF